MKIIGLTGVAGSGKDTVAELLAPYNFKRVAFADPLRELLYKLNPAIDEEADPDVGSSRLAEIVDWFGWDVAKRSYPEIRELLQRLGAGGRDVISSTVWINAALLKASGILVEGSNVVVTDVRYPNEIDAVRGYGGEVWRVVRPGTGPVNDHETETLLDKFDVDRVLVNNGTIDDLRIELGDMVADLLGPPF